MSPQHRPLSILLLADDQRSGASTIHDHIRAFTRYSRNTVNVFNPRNMGRSRFLRLADYDVVAIHYSIVVIWDEYLSPWFREQIAAFDGLKVQFIQDEYRFVDDVTAAIRALGIDLLYTVVPPERAEDVYGDRLAGVEIMPTLTGYAPERVPASAVVHPPAERPVDVGYRGRSLPFWLGALGHEKVEIGRGFVARAAAHGLRCDIAWTESARIYGNRWYEWIASCRTMLGSESGSSIVDYDRSAENAVRAYLAEHPVAGYEEVAAAALGPFAEGPRINTVSPRVFESAAMRTGLVLFPGEYSGVIRPTEHYIPLAKDFSNMHDVAEAIRDDALLERMTARTYDDLIASGAYSYRRFVAAFDEAVEARAGEGRRRGRFPRTMLRAEETVTGRGYWVSSAYGAVRAATMAWVGLRPALRSQPLRRLLRRVYAGRHGDGDTAGLWQDILRLGLLTDAQTGALVPADGPFAVVSTLEHGRLLLTSRSTASGEAGQLNQEIVAAVRSGAVTEIVWNHAAVGQYVAVELPGVHKRISLDVGRYDAYGVYRFEQLVRVSREEPDLVAAALLPLLRQTPSESESPSQ